MKKIFAIMLSAIMLLGVMSTVVFAEDIPNPWELEDFGQKSWTLYITDHEPAIDGIVEEGEYALVIDGLDVANAEEDDRTFLIDSPNDLEVDIHMSYDGDIFYLAFVVVDPEIILENAKRGEGIGMHFSADREKYAKDDRITTDLRPGATSNKIAEQVFTTVEDNVITYELSFDKYRFIDEYGLDELEMLYVLFNVSDETSENAVNEALYNALFFGFQSRDAAGLYPPGGAGNNRFPHVINFVNEELPESDVPETDAPETDAPETDAPATDAPETDAPATDAPATDAPATDAPETDAPTENKGGCKSSVAAMGVALVATLGACATFVSRKK